MRKTVKFLPIASLVALSFVACQSNENKPTTTATEPTPATNNLTATPAPTPATATAPVTPTAVTATPAAQPPTSKATVEPSKTTTLAKDQLTRKGATPAPTAESATAPTPKTAPAEKVAAVKWDETVYNWGSLKQGEKMTHVFKFTNTGKEPLIILDAKGSCGCTVPEKPAAPIAPGKTGEIKVVFDSNGKEGPQTKLVTITANTEPSTFALTIKGDVKKD